MLLAFLVGLAIVGTITVVALAVLGIKWFVNYCKNRLSKNKSNKVVFADMGEVVEDVIHDKVKNANTLSLEELEKMCSETPYIAAEYDPETEEVSEYEGFKVVSVEPQFTRKLEENEGMIVVNA